MSLFGTNGYFGKPARLMRKLRLREEGWVPNETKILIDAYGLQSFLEIAVSSKVANKCVILWGLPLVADKIKSKSDFRDFGRALSEIASANPNAAYSVFWSLRPLADRIRDVDDLTAYGQALVPIIEIAGSHTGQENLLQFGLSRFADQINEVEDLKMYGRLIAAVIRSREPNRSYTSEEQKLSNLRVLTATLGTEPFIALNEECGLKVPAIFGWDGILAYSKKFANASDVLDFGRALNDVANRISNRSTVEDVFRALRMFALTNCTEVLQHGRVLSDIAREINDPSKVADVLRLLEVFAHLIRSHEDVNNYGLAIADLTRSMSSPDIRSLRLGLEQIRDQVELPSDLTRQALLRKAVAFRASLPDRSYVEEIENMVPCPEEINLNYGSFPSGGPTERWDGTYITVRVDPDETVKNALDDAIDVLQESCAKDEVGSTPGPTAQIV